MQLYTSIEDLPIRLYWKVIEKQDLSYLADDIPKDSIAEEVRKALKDAWENIQTELLAIELQDPNYKFEIESERRHYLMKIKAALSSNTLDQLHYEMSKTQFEEEEKKPYDYEGSLVLLERTLHFHIDDMKMSTKRYFAHLKALKNGTKAN